MSATNTKRRPSTSSSSPTRRSQRLATKKADTDTQTQTHTNTPLLKSGLFYMALLALQFGCQPMLVQAFIPKGTPGRSIVIMTEMIKIGMCCAGRCLSVCVCACLCLCLCGCGCMYVCDLFDPHHHYSCTHTHTQHTQASSSRSLSPLSKKCTAHGHSKRASFWVLFLRRCMRFKTPWRKRLTKTWIP